MKTRLYRNLTVSSFFSATLLLPARAADTDAEALHAELNAIRQDYEKRISQLESRIQELGIEKRSRSR